jgi:hypothetical protein
MVKNKNMKTIKINNLKLIYLLIIYSIFFKLSLAFILCPDMFVSVLFRNKYILFLIGIISLPIMFLYSISYLLMYLDKKSGMIVTDEYIIDNSQYESLGKIMWKDVKGITKDNKNLVLIMKNKPEYIKKLNLNVFKKTLIFFKNWSYKTTIILNNSTLDCKQEEFEKIIYSAWEDFNSKK